MISFFLIRYGVVHYLWYLVGFFLIKIVLSYVMPQTVAVAIGIFVVLFVKWI